MTESEFELTIVSQWFLICVLILTAIVFYIKWQNSNQLPKKIICEAQKVYVRSAVRREDLQYEWLTKKSSYDIPPTHKWLEIHVVQISKIER